MTSIQLDMQLSELVDLLGEPLQQSFLDGRTILIYKSLAPTLSDTYMFENDRLIYVSTSLYTTPRILKEYIVKYGEPAASMKVYKSTIHDSFQTLIHVWPDVGVRVITVDGPSENAHVIREDQFVPQSLEKYNTFWGKEYASNSAVLIQKSEPVPTISIQQKNDLINGSGIINAEWIVIGLILIVCVIYVYRKKNAHK